MILAIDPSNTVHAWALLDGTAQGPRLVRFGRDLMRDEIPDPDGPWYPAVCEMIASYGLAAGAHLFDTCVEIGKLYAMFPHMRRVTRIEVKRLVCRSTSAKDQHVRQAIIDRFGGPTSIKKGGPLHGVAGDCWAAIAVGLAAMDPECRFYVPVAEREAQP